VNINHPMSCRKLPRFVIKCLGVECDVYMLYLKCINIRTITPRLANEAIIDCQLLKEYGISLNFAKESFSYTREGELKEHCSISGQDYRMYQVMTEVWQRILSVNI
jgi:hypothetical protein